MKCHETRRDENAALESKATTRGDTETLGPLALAYVDRVTALLTDEQARAVLGETCMRDVDGLEWLVGEGIVDEHCKLTDFGDWIARVLGVSRGE